MSHQDEIDEHQVHRRVADALADAHRRAVQARGARFHRSQAVDDGEVAIAMAVPVDPDAAAAFVDDRFDEARDRGRARGRRVSDRVGDAHALGAGANRRRVQLPERIRRRARRVLRHVHDGQALADRERHRLLGQPQQLLERPVLGVLPDRARPDERAGLDLESSPLRDLDDRLDVAHERAGRTIRAHAQAAFDDRAREPLDVRDDVRARARQADIGGIDGQRIDDLQDVNLLIDVRRVDRR
jgi:hypothetical protein